MIDTNNILLRFLSVCEDKHENCVLWEGMDECKANPFFMLANCHKSCKVCIDGKYSALLNKKMLKRLINIAIGSIHIRTASIGKNKVTSMNFN